MKSIKEWFEECEEEWAKEALRRVQYPTQIVSSLSQALLHGFNWNSYKVNKKLDNWLTIYNTIKQKETNAENNKRMV